jgi:hypothetical protein
MARANTAARSGRVKPTGLLKDYAGTKRNETSFLGDVQAHLLSESLKPSDRRQDVIHPSEMAKKDWCPRNTYYRIAGTPETDEHSKSFSFQLENIFAEGNSIHSKWQKWAWDMGKLWGHWRCLADKTVWYDLSPSECPVCTSTAIVYDEVPLSDALNSLISGHADGAIPSIQSLIEIKSIGMGTLRMEEPHLLAQYQVETLEGKKVYDLDDLWKNLRRPLASHVRQANVYLWLCRQMGLMGEEYTKMVFLYEFKANQAYKEFTIRYSPDIVAPLLEKAQSIQEALKTNKPPARPDFVEDDTASCCKICKWKTLCWDDKGAEKEVERDPAARPKVLRGQAKARADRDRDAEQAVVPAPRATGRHYIPGRSAADGDLREEHGVAGVDGDTAGSSRGRRKVRRVNTRAL